MGVGVTAELYRKSVEGQQAWLTGVAGLSTALTISSQSKKQRGSLRVTFLINRGGSETNKYYRKGLNQQTILLGLFWVNFEFQVTTI